MYLLPFKISKKKSLLLELRKNLNQLLLQLKMRLTDLISVGMKKKVGTIVLTLAEILKIKKKKVVKILILVETKMKVVLKILKKVVMSLISVMILKKLILMKVMRI